MQVPSKPVLKLIVLLIAVFKLLLRNVQKQYIGSIAFFVAWTGKMVEKAVVEAP